MRVLIIGSGPIGRLLATSMASNVQVGLGVRDARGLHDVRTARMSVVPRRQASAQVRRVELWPVSLVDGTDWDVVLSTAPLADPEVDDLLRSTGPDVVLGSVSQTPSEVDALRQLAGDRRWSLVTPGVLAWTENSVTHWWQSGPARFTLSGPGADMLSDTLFDGARWAARGSVSSALLSAAALMPIVASLQAADFDLRRARDAVRSGAAAADQAGRAIAAEHSVVEPRSISPLAVRVALRAARLIAPLNVESYLRRHFGSHTDQTVAMLADWIAIGQSHDLPTDALVTLRQNLVAVGAASS